MGADKIKLNFINRSNDTNNSSIVIFQTNVTQDLGELAVAWRVIENCMPGDNHPFVYPNEVQIGAEDSYGNFTPRYDVEPGEKWHMVQTQSGFELQLAGQPAGNATEFELANDLQQGAIDACVYRDGLLTAREPNIAPGMKAAFDFRPVLYMSVCPYRTGRRDDRRLDQRTRDRG